MICTASVVPLLYKMQWKIIDSMKHISSAISLETVDLHLHYMSVKASGTGEIANHALGKYLCSELKCTFLLLLEIHFHETFLF
jgi:hypothetical protein